MPNNILKIWTTLLGTTESDYGYSVTIGLDGSVFVGGTTQGALDGWHSPNFVDTLHNAI